MSNDPLAHPEIDPHNLEDDFDMEILLQHVKYIRSMCEIEPWKSGVIREVDPGPEYATDEQLRGKSNRPHYTKRAKTYYTVEYIKKVHTTSWRTWKVIA
jgi:hypothetical protein